jgi:hypothetical protein
MHIQFNRFCVKNIIHNLVGLVLTFAGFKRKIPTSLSQGRRNVLQICAAKSTPPWASRQAEAGLSSPKLHESIPQNKLIVR